MRVACVLFSASIDLQRFAEACLSLSPQIAMGPNCNFIEIGRCQKLYSEQTLYGRIQVILKKFSHSARVRIAHNIPTSLALCTYATNDIQKLPIEALMLYIDPFSVNDSYLSTIDILKKLGLTKLHQVQKVSKKALGIRFGRKMIEALNHLDDFVEIPWPVFNPLTRIIEQEKIDETYDIREIEPLTFLLKRLLERAMIRLKGHGKLPTLIELRFELEKYSFVTHPSRICKVDLMFPQRSVLPLLSMIRDRLHHIFSQQPLEAPIRTIEIEILSSVKSIAQQTNFFSRKEEELEEFRSIVNRLTERLGFDKAFLATPVESYTPEKSWKKTLTEPAFWENKLPERPIRILSKPHPMKRLEHYFLCGTKKWKARSVEGPERLSGEWWFHETERNYFRVATHEGEELWIFRNSIGEYFLHGIFD